MIGKKSDSHIPPFAPGDSHFFSRYCTLSPFGNHPALDQSLQGGRDIVEMKTHSAALLGATSLFAKVFREYMAEHRLSEVRWSLFGDAEILLTAEGDSPDVIRAESLEDVRDIPLILDFKSPRSAPLDVESRIVACGISARGANVDPVHVFYNPGRILEKGSFTSPHPAVCVLLRLLHDLPLQGLRHAHATLLFSTSEEGKPGNDELFNQTLALMNTQSAKSKVYKEQISFNLIPDLDADCIARISRELDAFLPKGLFTPPHLARAGMFFGTLMALDFSFSDPSAREAFASGLKDKPFLTWETKRHHGLIKAVQDDKIHAAVSCEEGDTLQLWVATDALRTGMAWNLWSLAEHFFQHYPTN